MTEYIMTYGGLFLTHWADALWIPLALLTVHKGQRLKAAGFVILCMLVLRLQIDIMQSFGFAGGFTGWLDWPLLYRGFAVYGFFTLAYLILSWLSPFTRGAIYLAASLSIFFMAFTVSTIVFVI